MNTIHFSKMELNLGVRKIEDIGKHFDPVTHVYKLDGAPVPSATTWIKSYVPEFKKEAVARIIAKNKGKTPFMVKKEWDLKAEISVFFGNMIHAISEMYYVNKDVLLNWYRGMSPSADIVIGLLDDITKNYEFIDSEKWRISDYFKIGYTMDGVFRSRPGVFPQTKYIILDHKTTKITDNEDYRAHELATKGKAKNAPYLKSPFKELGLRDVAFDKAAIQMSLYAIFIAYDDTIPWFGPDDLINVERWVVHIPMNPKMYEKGYSIKRLPNYDNTVLQELGV